MRAQRWRLLVILWLMALIAALIADVGIQREPRTSYDRGGAVVRPERRERDAPRENGATPNAGKGPRTTDGEETSSRATTGA